MPSAKTILIAHRHAAVRERFAAALADARHGFVLAERADAACRAAGDRATPVSLALVDLGLSADGPPFIDALRSAAGWRLPVAVFSGTVTSARQIPELVALEVVGYINEHAATAQILPALAPHLFPDNFDRRASARVPVGVPVSYRTGASITGARALNIGKGGVAIRTMSPLPVGTVLHVKFSLPGQPVEIDTSGRVAWSDRKVGMGIQFERIDLESQLSLDAFVDTHRS